MGTTESPEQQEGKSECDIQEEHRGQHESVRSQPRDHVGLDRLADVYGTFEDTWARVDFLLKHTRPFARAQQHQARLHDELKSSRESRDMALMKQTMSKVDGTREVLDIACRSLEDVRRPLKRKADDAHDRTGSHRKRYRRATEDHMKAEEVLNNSLGCLGDLVEDTASATHTLVL